MYVCAEVPVKLGTADVNTASASKAMKARLLVTNVAVAAVAETATIDATNAADDDVGNATADAAVDAAADAAKAWVAPCFSSRAARSGGRSADVGVGAFVALAPAIVAL